MDNLNLGKPIGALTGHTVPLNGFDQGEHGSGTGLAGGHVPSATNQAKGYGQDQSGFNAGLGGEHASGGIPSGQGHQSTPIADKFMGHSSNDAVSGAYEGTGTRNALTGESNAHTTGAGVGILGSNLKDNTSSSHSGLASSTGQHGISAGAYDGSINRSAESGHQSHSARDAALTGAAGATGATALGAGALGSHSHNTQAGVGAVGGSGGHYTTEGQHSSSHSGNDAGVGGNSAGILAAQQAGARGTHGNSGLTGAGVGAGAVGAGALGAGAASHGRDHDNSGIQSSKGIDDDHKSGEPLSNPKDLDTGSRHGLVFDKATGKYEHRHVVEGDRDGDKR